MDTILVTPTHLPLEHINFIIAIRYFADDWGTGKEKDF